MFLLSSHRSGRWKAVSFNTLSAVSAWKTRLGEWWPTLAKQVYLANSGSCYKQHDGSTEILFLCAWNLGNKGRLRREEWFCMSDPKCFHCAHQQATISAERLVFLSFSEEKLEWERDEESCWNLPICCLKLSFVAAVCAQLHPERGEDPAQYSVTRAALQLSPSVPFSASRVHDLQSNSFDNACTNIGSSSASLAFCSNIVHLCMCVSQWGVARRRVIMTSGGSRKELADSEVCNLFVAGPFLPLPTAAALQPNELSLAQCWQESRKRDNLF